MRICLVYDCLFPYTVGGAERWYRNLGERLAADGHEVTYLTLRQWDRDERAEVPGVRVVSAGPRMELYASGGRRRVLPPLVFGVGVLWHLLRHGAPLRRGPHRLVPVLLAAGGGARAPAAPLPAGGRLARGVERASTGASTSGRSAAASAGAVQALCLRVPQRAFCFSQLHARRLRDAPRERRAHRARGRCTRAARGGARARCPPSRWWSSPGRHIPEKRVPALVPALALARERIPELRGEILGDGPEREEVLRLRSRARARRRARRARVRERRARGERARAGALHGAPVAARGLRDGRGRGGRARHAERRGRRTRTTPRPSSSARARTATWRPPPRPRTWPPRSSACMPTARRCASEPRAGFARNARAAVARDPRSRRCSSYAA